MQGESQYLNSTAAFELYLAIIYTKKHKANYSEKLGQVMRKNPSAITQILPGMEEENLILSSQEGRIRYIDTSHKGLITLFVEYFKPYLQEAIKENYEGVDKNWLNPQHLLKNPVFISLIDHSLAIIAENRFERAVRMPAPLLFRPFSNAHVPASFGSYFSWLSSYWSLGFEAFKHHAKTPASKNLKEVEGLLEFLLVGTDNKAAELALESVLDFVESFNVKSYKKGKKT